MRGGPWLFNRFNVILQPFRVHEIPAQVPLVQTPYWVQVHDLPVWLRKQSTAQSLGRGFAGFIAWDKSDSNRFGEFFRIRVWVNVTVPLRRGQALTTEGGQPFEVFFKYERLRNFCYRCGLIDHVIRDCDVPPPADETQANVPYGPWLRAGDGANDYWRNRDGVGRDDRRRGVAVGNDGNGENVAGVGVGQEDDLDVDAELEKLEEENRDTTSRSGHGSRVQEEDNNTSMATETLLMGSSSSGTQDKSHEDSSFTFPSVGLPAGGDENGGGGGATKPMQSAMFSDTNPRKRAVGTSDNGASHMSSGSGVSPPLKRQNNISGLGMAKSVDQLRPPQ